MALNDKTESQNFIEYNRNNICKMNTKQLKFKLIN